MTGPAVVQDDPMLRLQYYRETGQSEEAKQYEAYLRETKQYRGAPTAPPSMAGRMARENANDADALAAQPSPLRTVLETFAAHALNAAQGIPGVEAIEAGAGVLGSKFTKNPLTYEQSLNTLRDATGNIGGKTSSIERIMGSLPLTSLRVGALALPSRTATLAAAGRAALPSSPAALGGLLGAADEALNADPNQSLLERGTRTALGAGAGALTGRVLDKTITAGKSLLRPSAASELLGMKADRAASAKTMYDLAIQHGEGKEATQAVKAYVAEPEIADIVGELQKTSALANVAPESPVMLDAIYKTLSDRAATVKKGLEAVSPTRPNIGRFRGKDIASAQDRLLTAMEAPGEKTITTVIPPMETAQSPAPSLRDAIRYFQDRSTAAYTRNAGTVEQRMARRALERHGAEDAIGPLAGAPSETVVNETRSLPAVMPTYRAAVNDFAKRSGDIGGMQKGYEAVLSKLSNTIPSFKNLDRKTPEAFAEWAKTATPSQLDAARRGILGAVQEAFGQQGKTLAPGRRATSVATGLLRIVDPNAGSLARFGLLGVNGAGGIP